MKVPRNHTKQFPPVKEPVNQTQMDIIDTKAVHGMMPGTGGGPNREQGPHGAARLDFVCLSIFCSFQFQFVLTCLA